MTDADVQRIAEAVHDKILNGPHGVAVSLILPGGTQFLTLLPGVPRAGELLWHPFPRRNSKPRQFLVERTEWWSTYPDIHVKIFLRPVTIAETPISSQG